MLQALWSASSGMLAQQMSMDNVANNIANVNTTGYKKSRVEFQDLLYSQMREPGRETRTGQVIPTGFQTGAGTRAAATQLLLEQGSSLETGNPTDFFLTGDAFFEVLLPDGGKYYTRDGSFKINADGFLVTGDGYTVNMEAVEGGLLTFAEGASGINVDSKGIISRQTNILELEAYTFTSPKDLEKVESGIFRPTEKSGDAVLLSEIETEDGEEAFDEEGNPLPVAEKPEPQVFYQVILPDGDTGYTTENSFKVDEEGRLVTVDKGYLLEPEVSVDIENGPLKAGNIIASDNKGVVSVPVEVGSLSIVTFTNPAGLEKVGSNFYRQTENSGNAQAAGNYKVVQGSLEMSNVQVAEEMVAMMMAQRAYEMSSRSIKTSDEMLGMANSLLRR